MVENKITVGVPLVGTLNVNTNSKMETISRAPMKGAPTVGDIVGGFKSKTTNAYIKMVKNGTCHHSTNVYGNVITMNIFAR